MTSQHRIRKKNHFPINGFLDFGDKLLNHLNKLFPIGLQGEPDTLLSGSPYTNLE
jgi:hypothetical protein